MNRTTSNTFVAPVEVGKLLPNAQPMRVFSTGISRFVVKEKPLSNKLEQRVRLVGRSGTSLYLPGDGRVFARVGFEEPDDVRVKHANGMTFNETKFGFSDDGCTGTKIQTGVVGGETLPKPKATYLWDHPRVQRLFDKPKVLGQIFQNKDFVAHFGVWGSGAHRETGTDK